MCTGGVADGDASNATVGKDNAAVIDGEETGGGEKSKKGMTMQIDTLLAV